MCNEDKLYHHFKIEFIDKILIKNETYEKKMNEYTVIKKINEVKDPKIKKLLIEFDDYISD